MQIDRCLNTPYTDCNYSTRYYSINKASFINTKLKNVDSSTANTSLKQTIEHCWCLASVNITGLLVTATGSQQLTLGFS